MTYLRINENIQFVFFLFSVPVQINTHNTWLVVISGLCPDPGPGIARNRPLGGPSCKQISAQRYICQLAWPIGPRPRHRRPTNSSSYLKTHEICLKNARAPSTSSQKDFSPTQGLVVLFFRGRNTRRKKSNITSCELIFL